MDKKELLLNHFPKSLWNRLKGMNEEEAAEAILDMVNILSVYHSLDKKGIINALKLRGDLRNELDKKWKTA